MCDIDAAHNVAELRLNLREPRYNRVLRERVLVASASSNTTRLQRWKLDPNEDEDEWERIRNKLSTASFPIGRAHYKPQSGSEKVNFRTFATHHLDRRTSLCTENAGQTHRYGYGKKKIRVISIGRGMNDLRISIPGFEPRAQHSHRMDNQHFPGDQ